MRLEADKNGGGNQMREKGRIVRLLSCDLKVAEDITDELSTYNLAWIWVTDTVTVGAVKEKGPFVILPCQGIYDFGLDDELPLDWLVWTEHSDKSVSVIHDLCILQSLGVRGNFIINVVGSLTVEKWELTNHFISTHTREVTFDGDPDETIPMEEK